MKTRNFSRRRTRALAGPAAVSQVPPTVEPMEARLLLSSVSGTVYNDVGDITMNVTGDAGVAGAIVYLDTNHNGALDTTPVSVVSSSAVSIKAGTSANSTLPVKGLTGVVVNLTVTLNVSQKVDSDLTVSLVDPAGTTVRLLQNDGSGSNFIDTTFNDNAPAPVAQGIAPFSSIAGYQPTAPLSAFIGANGNGTWTLRVADASGPLTPAVLDGWSLHLNEAAEPTIVTGSTGKYTFSDLAAASTYQVGVIPPTGRSLTTFGNIVVAANTQYADFGTFLPMTIKGTIFEDLNGNGLQDPGDPLLSNQRFYIDSSGTGQFEFDSAPVTYNASSDLAIPSSGIVSLPINVTGRYPELTDVTTGIQISGDSGIAGMTAFLVSPSGMQVALFSTTPHGNVDATFSDAASTPVQEADGELNGMYQPYALNKLSAFQGEYPNGVWNLVLQLTAPIGARLPSNLKVSGSVSVLSSEQVFTPNTEAKIKPPPPHGGIPCTAKRQWMPVEVPIGVVSNSSVGADTLDADTLVSSPIITTDRVVELASDSGASVSVKFGEATAASISGTVYNDENGSGVHDSSDPGVAGATVYLDRNGDGKLDTGGTYTYSITSNQAITKGGLIASNETTTVDANGLITLVGVQPDVSPGTGATGLTYRLISPSGQTGLVTFNGSSIGTCAAFNGANPSGVWTLQVSGPSSYTGTLVSWKLILVVGDPTVTTNADGSYAFTGLDLNNPYVVRVVPPVSGEQTTEAAAVTLSSGQQVTGDDIGLFHNAVSGGYLFSGTVFYDANDNGTLNTGETGLEGWEIYDDVKDVGKFEAGDPFTFTNSAGDYTIKVTGSGTGILRQVVPVNWSQTTPASNAGFPVSATSAYASYNFGDYTSVKYLSTVATTPGLAAWWTFDTASQGNSIVNGITGTLEGGATISTAAGAPISGESDNTGLSLNGKSAFVNTDLTTQDEFTTAATINVWIDLGSTPGASGHIYSIAAKSQFRNDLDLQIETDGVHFYTDTGSSVVYNPSTIHNGLIGWHMVTAVFDTNAKIREIFWDGQLVASNNPYTGTHGPSTQAFSIGESDVFTGRYYDGSIDEVSLWNQALTAAQILAIYDAAKGT